jgi:hypothetical protein
MLSLAQQSTYLKAPSFPNTHFLLLALPGLHPQEDVGTRQPRHHQTQSDPFTYSRKQLASHRGRQH